MAEFGAEVIKVELPKVGDPCRRLGSVTECGDTLVWLSEARNKKSVTLDMRKPEGVALLKRLVGISDVVTENFRSEEHTSELQSLMRISYAVFCLKKKKQTDRA